MKIFVFTYKGQYGGGCAIVAANSLIEAFCILSSDEFILDYTDLEHGFEEPLLKADESITEPKIIINRFYQE